MSKLHDEIMSLSCDMDLCPRKTGECMNAYKLGHRDARHAAAALVAAAEDIPAQPGIDESDDLLDVVRALCSMSEYMASMSDEKRKHYPSPLSEFSPLMEAAQAACVKRGYTVGGLEIPPPPAQPENGGEG
ncbi:hypothetical protein [Massilia sp. CCM 8734]|uniref:hypothetical protein n=1 Tax=Massilia sp. CCM 8734 TaxID=2609283 RepID=UPI00141DA74E|nr:hypothetical protein [Massilia sp. CCM 8734]NHZ94631.1 hypothetical protein [Massilia sp. CCM 8734]